jgi:hypothetical protein
MLLPSVDKREITGDSGSNQEEFLVVNFQEKVRFTYDEVWSE